ncbi:MAG: helix-turn-helix domain-containing protein [Pusillimonas sp.]
MNPVMNHSLTAEDLFSEMQRMPATERVRFFSLLTGSAFRDDDFTHEQVFGHLQQEPFSTAEAAEYLEVSVPTLRRYVQSGKLVPSHVIGRNQMFSAQTLRAFKRSRH